MTQFIATPNTSTAVAPRNRKSGSNTSINELLNRVLEKGDYPAFEKLFHSSYRSLCTFCFRFVQVREVAEEVVSEVFFKIWNNRKRIMITSSAESYLYTSVRNLALDHLRKEKRSLWTDLDSAMQTASSAHDPLQQREFEETRQLLEDAVNKLPKQCRLIFQLSRDQGMKYHEIAEMLQLSVKTIETQMGRALKSLRMTLKAEVPEPVSVL
jgi:RNA polymerase sigma-70 factor, ECF subfamily